MIRLRASLVLIFVIAIAVGLLGVGAGNAQENAQQAPLSAASLPVAVPATIAPSEAPSAAPPSADKPSATPSPAVNAGAAPAPLKAPAKDVLSLSDEILLQEYKKDTQPVDMSSILFTYWEHTALVDARRSRGLVRPPSEAELMRNLKQGEAPIEKVKPPPEKREISLGGISYRSPKEWTIWLNGQRVTPKALPTEALDLKVYKDYIEVRWLDDYTNQILPIRLRPHQRFNVDTRIFLPGVYR